MIKISHLTHTNQSSNTHTDQSRNSEMETRVIVLCVQKDERGGERGAEHRSGGGGGG